MNYLFPPRPRPWLGAAKTVLCSWWFSHVSFSRAIHIRVKWKLLCMYLILTLYQTLLFFVRILFQYFYKLFFWGAGVNEKLILRVFCVLFGWDQDLTFS